MTQGHPGVPHPVEVLMDEHEIIIQVLLAAERRSFDLNEGATLDSEFWLHMAGFLADFADGFHHAKEENHLFPALVAHGMDAEQGPIAVMLHEHEQGRKLLSDLRAGIEDHDPRAVARAAASYAYLLRDHIQKENMVLFEMAQRVLPGDVAVAMSQQFAELRRAAESSGAHWNEVAEGLCAAAGIEFRPPKTRTSPFEV